MDTTDELSKLAVKLDESAEEVMAHPHPSHCEHLHKAHAVMREAAAAIRAVGSGTVAPHGWKLVPLSPTAEMIAAAVGAVLPEPHPLDFELARSAARLVMMHPNTPPNCTVEALAAAMATIIPAHRAMLAAAPLVPL
jgi:hypothetical protein